MNEQFTFSNIGVADWLSFVYAGGSNRVNSECAAMDSDFVGWLSYRFNLAPGQISYLISLGQLVHESYSASIQNVLLLGGSITLDKPVSRTASDDPLPQNPKVVFKEQQDEVSEEPDPEPDPDPEPEPENRSASTVVRRSSLNFRIVYLPS